MPLADSDFNGPTGDTFTLAISAGRIFRASLHIVNQNDTTLAVSGGDQQVTVPSLPAGDSLIQLIMKPWFPGEPNATVSFVPGSSGHMAATGPNPRIDDGSMFGSVNLFGS
jgi:hypothetical protein